MWIERVTAADTEPLRRAVLRPGSRTGDPLALPGDQQPGVVQLAAYDDNGTIVGCGNVRLDPAPFPTNGLAWRLRGMATDPAHRSTGVGAAVLRGLLDHARGEGGDVLWCNARIPAQRFYEREGLQTWGEPWTDPVIGPHIVMWTTLQ